MSLNETDSNSGRKIIGIALLAISICLIIGVLLPWIAVDLHWSGSNVTADFSYIMNGLGRGEVSSSVDLQDTNFDTSWSVYAPLILTMVGIPILTVAVLNILVSLYLFDKKTRDILPKSLNDFMQEHYSRLILAESIIVIGICFAFTLLYFQISLPMPLAEESTLDLSEYFGSKETDLHNFYKSIFSFFEWTKSETGNAKINVNGNLDPGIGYYFSFSVGFVLLYVWFLNYIIREKEWPILWQQRGVLAPLMIALGLMPSVVKASGNTGILPPVLLTPFFNYIGAAYFISSCVFFFLVHKNSEIEKELNEAVKVIYVKEQLTEEELEKQLNKVDTLRAKSSKFRKFVGITLFTATVLAWLFVIGTLAHYMDFMAGTVPGTSIKYMMHAPTLWLLLFVPLINIIIYIIFQH